MAASVITFLLRFTCTFMELKPNYAIFLHKLRQFYLYLYGIETQQHYELEEKLDVLLVPLWN